MPVPSCWGCKNEWDIVISFQLSIGDRHRKKATHALSCKVLWGTQEWGGNDVTAQTSRVKAVARWTRAGRRSSRREPHVTQVQEKGANLGNCKTGRPELNSSSLWDYFLILRKEMGFTPAECCLQAKHDDIYNSTTDRFSPSPNCSPTPPNLSMRPFHVSPGIF